jgi:hypothetical protein
MGCNQFDRVRATTICVGCNGHKDVGLVLCWPCHRKQKAANDGGYSKAIEAKLDQLEVHQTMHAISVALQ